MISVFLPSYPFRGYKAPYLWVVYKILTFIKEPIYFIIGKNYLFNFLYEKNRWENEKFFQENLGFKSFNLKEKLKDHLVYKFDESFFKNYKKSCFYNPSEIFKKFLTEIIPELKNLLFSALKNKNYIECIITWCNCPSLSFVAKKKNIKVIHLELGPLRDPNYLFTSYFDFNGINKNSEAEKRFYNNKYNLKSNISLKEIWKFFYKKKITNNKKKINYYNNKSKFNLGIVLQVENDSNMIAFNKSFNNQFIIDYANCNFLGKKLVRCHPGSIFFIKNNYYKIDNSDNVIDFIKKTNHILTINSSVGLEAMLLNVPVTILGECSYSFCNVKLYKERVKRLLFYLFTYLVPFDLSFNVSYIRFRLSNPNETEITKKHIEYYMKYNNFNINKRNKKEIFKFLKKKIITSESIQLLNVIKELSISIKNKEKKINFFKKKINLKKNILKKKKNKLDIILPVFNSFKEVKRCVKSLIKTLPNWVNLIVIDDCSSDIRVTEWLRKKSLIKKFNFIRNKKNIGFVSSVNFGMKFNRKNDVLLLNSDTEVANNWIERIYKSAYSNVKIGSITPFSNNATICSFPNFCKKNDIFLNMSVKNIDNYFFKYSPKNNLIQIPTSVGFCMYIKRECLDQVGLFNEKLFKKGYGEENDWCQRAIKMGWKHFHQTNVFVYHKGESSFGNKSFNKKEYAIKKLNSLYTNYSNDILNFIKRDPAKKIRQKIFLKILSKVKIYKILLISHNMGGGVENHINELVKFYKNKAYFLLLTPGENKKNVILSFKFINKLDEEFSINIENKYSFLIKLLKFIGICHIHFHHIIGFSDKILKLSNKLKCNYDITIHDYYIVNSNPTLTDKHGIFIEDDISNRDQICYKKYFIKNNFSVKEWRNKFYNWLYISERIIFPSIDTKNRFLKIFPICKKNSLVAWHPDFEKKSPYPKVSLLYNNNEKNLRILVIGALSYEKGALLLNNVSKKVNNKNIEFHLLGYSCIKLNNIIKCHGSYSNNEIKNKLKKINPHIIWYPAQWPETYSYTLSIALEYGFPVVVPNIGSFVERVYGRKYSKIIRWNSSVEYISKMWENFYKNPKNFFETKKNNSTKNIKFNRVKDFYKKYYLNKFWLKDIIPYKISLEEISNLLKEVSYLIENSEKKINLKNNKEFILKILLKINTISFFKKIIKLIPYKLKIKIKRYLSSRPIYEIIKSKKTFNFKKKFK